MMGGDRETFLEPAEKAQSAQGPASPAAGVMGSVGGNTGNRIRIHESGGEVHFHDDTTKLKAAVPVSEWFRAWQKLSSQPQRQQFFDPKNNTTLVVETRFDNGAVDAVITLSQMTTGTNFSELSKFTTRK
jgi:hypothetical protein